MTIPPHFREQLLKALLQTALAGYQQLSAHYQRTKQELEELSDYDLLDIIKHVPRLHMRHLLATCVLMQRGYYLSDIREIRRDS
ncbi:hypothetical protein [Vibrio scophthalmi]|uniref:Uncharacterized protein n=1 Tax=Vibrio scophthalmi TaxID=45658 RepID=A0A1C7FEJ6_9VIBR|nr:hypothetical protein [Vibrio scophthalmi]ANU38158.1 hypothetical protein VSVS05_03120 [Vibrio scophthalmi]ODS10554.1 hypothetical protein VSF3289_00813 [Vibrio scophthalmi]